MKNLKKTTLFILSLLMTASLATAFAACGGESGESSSSVDAPVSSSVEDSSPEESASEDVSSSEDSSMDESSSEDSSPEGSSSEDSSPENSSVEDDSSSEDSSSEDDSSVEDDERPVITTQEEYKENGNTYPALKVAELYGMYSWTEYELVSEAKCTTAGVKQAHWVEDESVVHQEHIAPRGHDYNNGICKGCGTGPVFPADTPGKTFIDPTNKNSGIEGTGKEYDRYELEEGYYQFDVPRSGVYWLSFAISEPGQYALYTVGKADTSVEIARYDASAQYIPIDANGNYISFPARSLSSGVLYSSFNCSTLHWSTSWRATYTVKGKAGTTVKLRLVKIDEEAWSPKTVREQYLAAGINGKHAPSGPENTKPVAVDWESEYFYEESSGYYRLGTPENPGDIIYVAITKVAERMLQDKSFTQIQYEAASNLYLHYGTTIEGDYLVRDYIPCISNDIDCDGSYDNDNCYQNYVNVDGLYPVNQELFEFLNLYTQKNMPISWPSELGTWHSEYYNQQAWLAACYHYKNLTPGSKDLPYEINETGTQTVESGNMAYNYYTLSYKNENSLSTITYCTISWTNPMLAIIANNVVYKTPGSILVETSGAHGFTFGVGSTTGMVGSFEIVITPAYAGSQDDPEALTISKETTSIHLNSIEHLVASGAAPTHQKYYVVTITESGILDFSCDQQVNVIITYNGDMNVQLESWTPLEVQAGDVIEIVVGPASNAVDCDVTVSLT